LPLLGHWQACVWSRDCRSISDATGHSLSDSQAKLNNKSVLQEILKDRDLSNLVMITHDLNISNIVREPTVKMGEFFVLQHNGTDFEVIGKIRMGDQ
jgi:hypothetical protein